MRGKVSTSKPPPSPSQFSKKAEVKYYKEGNERKTKYLKVNLNVGSPINRKARSISPKDETRSNSSQKTDIKGQLIKKSPERKLKGFEFRQNKSRSPNIGLRMGCKIPSRINKSPSPTKAQTDRSGDKISKITAKMKRQLNEELWEASENGDLVAISRLLAP